MKTRNIIIIGVLAAAAIGGYLYWKSKKDSDGSTSDGIAGTRPPIKRPPVTPQSVRVSRTGYVRQAPVTAESVTI